MTLFIETRQMSHVYERVVSRVMSTHSYTRRDSFDRGTNVSPCRMTHLIETRRRIHMTHLSHLIEARRLNDVSHFVFFFALSNDSLYQMTHLIEARRLNDVSHIFFLFCSIK